jgi:hypothetical protein
MLRTGHNKTFILRAVSQGRRKGNLRTPSSHLMQPIALQAREACADCGKDRYEHRAWRPSQQLKEREDVTGSAPGMA